MKKKVGIEREKKENETSRDDARGGREREREREERGRVGGGRGNEGGRKRQGVLEEYRSRGDG